MRAPDTLRNNMRVPDKQMSLTDLVAGLRGPRPRRLDTAAI
ncbi:hypothetical protein [Mycolicibacterium alvei]